MEGFARGKGHNQEKENKNKFKYIEEALNNYPYGYSVEDILNEKFGEENTPEKEEMAKNFSDYFEKEAEKKEREMIDSWKEYSKDLKREEKEEKINLLNDYKKIFTPDLVEEERQILQEERNNKHEYYAYVVDSLARKLATEYLNKIKREATKANIEKLKDELKEYFYNKYRSHNKNKPADNLLNFYEVDSND